MANYLTIAVVTATLVEIVQAAVKGIVPGAIVKVGLPKSKITSGEKEVNIYPYLVSPDAQMRNLDLPMRAADGRLTRRPQTAIRLHYIISFSSQDDPLSLEIMMGKVISTFHALPTLSPDEITRIISSKGNYPKLSDSDLAEQMETVKITPEYLSLEELSKLWSVFFQVAHRPSLQYLVSPILLDADLPPSLALPMSQIMTDVAL